MKQDQALSLPMHRVRALMGWTVLVAGAAHGLAQALPLLARGF